MEHSAKKEFTKASVFHYFCHTDWLKNTVRTGKALREKANEIKKEAYGDYVRKAYELTPKELCALHMQLQDIENIKLKLARNILDLLDLTDHPAAQSYELSGCTPGLEVSGEGQAYYVQVTMSSASRPNPFVVLITHPLVTDKFK